MITSDMMTLPFCKVSGAGNDFVVINLLDQEIRNRLDGFLKTLERSTGTESNLRSYFAKKICRRDHSIGADGAIFLEPSRVPGASFKWDFYNSDGSAAEMCGNAARCVARIAFERGLAQNQILFETVAGVVEAEHKGDTKVTVHFRFPHLLQEGHVVNGFNEEKISGAWIDSGVPHFVVIENPPRANLERRSVAKFLRASKELGARGANITFVSRGRHGQVEAVTFERGVEDFTKSCGTGAIAAAFALHLHESERSISHIRMPGGALQVELIPEAQRAQLTGDALLLYDGSMTMEATL